MIKVKQNLKIQDIHNFIMANRGEGQLDGNGGIILKGGYVSICNSKEIYLEKRRDIAELLSEKYHPFGDELVINFHP